MRSVNSSSWVRREVFVKGGDRDLLHAATLAARRAREARPPGRRSSRRVIAMGPMVSV